MTEETYEPVTGILVGFQPLRVSGKIRALIEFEPEISDQCMRALGGNVLPSESRHVAIVRINDVGGKTNE